MASSTDESGLGVPRQPAFRTTHWSVVLAAGEGTASTASVALETLCQRYWYPLYAFVRRSGHSPTDAEDLTQSFFARMLEKRYLGLADPAKGKFRTFLLCALKRFLVDEWEKTRTEKRGGGVTVISLNEEAAEGRYQREPADGLTAEAIYERRWAHSVLEDVLRRLEAEFASAGKAEQFKRLKVYLVGDKGEVPFSEAAAALQMSESAVKAVVHRMRQRYCELVREVVAETLDDPREIDGEIRQLLAALV